MITRADVVACARTWLRTPYQHQQRMKGVAVDCGGVAIGVARELGLVVPEFDVTGYARVPDGYSLIAACDESMDRIAQSDMQPGDVVAGRFENDPQHIAILGDYPHGGLTLIHALNRKPDMCVIETRFDRRLPFKLVQAYSFRGIA